MRAHFSFNGNLRLETDNRRIFEIFKHDHHGKRFNHELNPLINETNPKN